MNHIALTGGNGFLGWHTRASQLETGTSTRSISVGSAFSELDAKNAINQSSRLIHIAGVNRGTEDEVRDGNILFAEQIAQALIRAENPPSVVVFANSIQAKNGNAYGNAKSAAADVLRAATEKVGARFDDMLLPNLFGEHGRPFYNAVTATFSHLLVNGDEPSVQDDKELTLLHVQDAADILTGVERMESCKDLEVRESVSGLLRRLKTIASYYRSGEIPDITDKFNRDLFNTYRSYCFPKHAPIQLTRHADARGSFFEVIRSRGGAGQSSFSTTEPGISRGDHFHRRKIERFTVLSGTATIAIRRLFTNETFEFKVTGEDPVAVDMPTMWAHKITNTGASTLFTSFWTNDIFDPTAPDTIAEAV